MHAPTNAKNARHNTLAALTLGAIGVVYGDIGTSPRGLRLKIERNPSSPRLVLNQPAVGYRLGEGSPS